jgi:hypothetical protein
VYALGGIAALNCFDNNVNSIRWLVNGTHYKNFSNAEVFYEVDNNSMIGFGTLRFTNLSIDFNMTVIMCTISSGSAERNLSFLMRIQG